ESTLHVHQKSPKLGKSSAKSSPKKVQSQAPQPAPRSMVSVRTPRGGPPRSSTPPFSSEEDTARDGTYVTSPRTRSAPSVRVVQSGPRQTQAADGGEDWSDTEPSEGPVNTSPNRTPRSQGSVVQSLTRSLERQLSSPMAKPAGGVRVIPPVTATSHKPSAVMQLSDEDSDLELSSIEEISPRAAGGRTVGPQGGVDSAGSPGTSVWSSSASRRGGW
ncbi:hypothetical protein AGOR_G00178620, partial [Albula goreensis]